MAFSSRNLLSLARTALRAARHLARPPAKVPRAQTGSSRGPGRQPSSAQRMSSAGSSSAGTSRGGVYAGHIRPVYAPKPDGAPDPGEVVWAWVPYEEDPSQGKDRPVLLIGRSGSGLLGLMLTTRDRNNSRASDPAYLDIGSGAWDSKGRPSEVKLDRIITLDPSDVRRQGAVVDRAVFERVARRLAGLRD
ncbi:type II toxin-antitoxin system PemK/MazF family toxin [Arthrobacter gandavensis]|uniref:type II toxin-antitoxin system PemK/MazF family toxin n=1 Tax=Arthrobacter gandavensis TaxID=169960 RepID=UPI001890380E|nr:type II toxin-antitoxin system PemK/MazF family toxin [Arthrobacter gandavensis]MBF4995244.1 type II toxin-antitoxin system PemK/MazF family toxin [Arthrobacter gandavensis]